MTNKMTNRRALEWAINSAEDALLNFGDDFVDSAEGISYPMKEVLAKLKTMAASLDNKASNPNRKPTAKQIENAELREKILEFMREHPNQLFTCTEIGKAIPELEGQQNQKISALMRPLIDNKSVDKTSVKGKSLFQIAKSMEEEG